MNPALLVFLVLVAVVAGVYVGQRAKAFSDRKPRSLAGRAKDLAGKKVSKGLNGLLRSITGRRREPPSDDET